MLAVSAIKPKCGPPCQRRDALAPPTLRSTSCAVASIITDWTGCSRSVRRLNRPDESSGIDATKWGVLAPASKV